MQLDGAEKILEFWFGADDAPNDVRDQLAARWFVRDDGFDGEIRARFSNLIDAAISGELDSWTRSPRSWLALLLLLDQFPRNIYRESSLAFCGDYKAQRTAVAGISRGDDRELPIRYRVFAYLPLEHAEDLLLQRRSVALIEALAEDPDAKPAAVYAQYLDYAKRHCEVIARFGRFPHRNDVLGRISTPGEHAYLNAGGGF